MFKQFIAPAIHGLYSCPTNRN